MFCPACGKAIPENSIYCMFCGKPVTDPAGPAAGPEPQWDRETFEHMAPDGERLDSVAGAETTSEDSARLSLWYKHEAEVWSMVQPRLDQRWEPEGPVGPDCLVLIQATEKGGFLSGLLGKPAAATSWWWVGVRIPLRRAREAAGKAGYDVVLVSAGPRKIEVIKAIRVMSAGKLGLAEAKKLAETPNSIVLSGVSEWDAKKAKAALEAAGATAQIR